MPHPPAPCFHPATFIIPSAAPALVAGRMSINSGAWFRRSQGVADAGGRCHILFLPLKIASCNTCQPPKRDVSPSNSTGHALANVLAQGRVLSLTHPACSLVGSLGVDISRIFHTVSARSFSSMSDDLYPNLRTTSNLTTFLSKCRDTLVLSNSDNKHLIKCCFSG